MSRTIVDLMREAESKSAGKRIAEFPIRLYAGHMAEILGISLNAFYKLEAKGEFTEFEHKPRIGRKTWSRDLVQAWNEGRLNEVNRTKLRLVGGR